MSIPPPIYGSPPGPLEYAAPIPMRPGILTAVGVLSIIFGAISALVSAGGVLSGIIYLAMSNIHIPMPIPATMPATAPAAGSGTVTYTYVTATAHATNVMPAGAFGFQVSHGASALTITESALSICAAVLLIVAGILLLREWPRADRLHRIYVAIKIPLIATAAIATWWTYVSLMSGFNTMTAAGAPGANFFGTMAVVQALLSAGFSLIYPVALLIVLSTGSSRRYFARLRAGAIVA